MEKLIATLHNNSMRAKSPSLLFSLSIVDSPVKMTGDLEYRKRRGNSAMKIGSAPLGAITRSFDRDILDRALSTKPPPLFARRVLFFPRGCATRASIISYRNVCTLFNATLRFPLNLDMKRLVLVNISAVYRFPRHPFAHAVRQTIPDYLMWSG